MLVLNLRLEGALKISIILSLLDKPLADFLLLSEVVLVFLLEQSLVELVPLVDLLVPFLHLL